MDNYIQGELFQMETVTLTDIKNFIKDDMDGEKGFKPLSNDVYEWECGDRSIELPEVETKAFKRLGLITEETLK